MCQVVQMFLAPAKGCVMLIVVNPLRPTTSDVSRATERLVESNLELDVGCYLDDSELKKLTDELKYKLITKPFTPDEKYDYKMDVEKANKKRRFCHNWLVKYPWLVYSPRAKGPLCKYCVVFRQPINRGTQGSFINKTYTKYRKFHDAAKGHAQSAWHKNAVKDAHNFIRICDKPEHSLICQIDQSARKQIDENRAKLRSILRGIVFLWNS